MEWKRAVKRSLRPAAFGFAVLVIGSTLGPVGSIEAFAAHADPTLLEARTGDPTEIDWRTLAGLDYTNGVVSEELKALNGQLVKVPGFTVPLEDWATQATEFLLVPYVGACVHTPPPPPNQLVYVKMNEGRAATLDGWNPMWIEGVLKIETTENIYGQVGFTIEGVRLYPYEY